jgi:hypothetical protein
VLSTTGQEEEDDLAKNSTIASNSPEAPSPPHHCTESALAALFCSTQVRQCVLYDGPGHDARLIGVEYLISARLFEGLPEEEKK